MSDLTVDAGQRQAVVQRAQVLLLRYPIAASYRDLLSSALALPGNILSSTPDLRWARIICVCCAALKGSWHPAVPAAAALELYMVASDLLDDLQDQEANAISSVEGDARTLDATTGLLLLGLAELLRASHGAAAVGILIDASLRACSGQDADLRLHASEVNGLEESLGITDAKSGSLVAAACRLGALAGGAERAIQERFAAFDRLVGIVKQLVNDLAALDPTTINKTDVCLARPTLPLVYSFMYKSNLSR